MNKNRMAVISPVIVIIIGLLTALVFYQMIHEWAFIPLAIVYWGVTFAISWFHKGKDWRSILGRPTGGRLWPVLCVIVGFIPAPILLLNLHLFKSPLVIFLWMTFAIINPFFEEIYWRGYLLDCLPFKKNFCAIYSTVFFVLSHPLMWGIFSIANRSFMMYLSLSIMGIVWSITYQKTKSLRWCIISHFLVDIFNLSVFVFLNLYIPPSIS